MIERDVSSKVFFFFLSLSLEESCRDAGFSGTAIRVRRLTGGFPLQFLRVFQ